ncbi:hypothetical protein OH76DRAFT_102525 [Lentinus brumalis]|uniref:Uncharacterized protein n=1 Tax=Lentinus brumalis TaxID=2498619 RepID=A0A371CQG3_9APHY|nr:hypothetical protein OH76DRAFT_102525 [Polyporus brumalis]
MGLVRATCSDTACWPHPCFPSTASSSCIRSPCTITSRSNLFSCVWHQPRTAQIIILFCLSQLPPELRRTALRTSSPRTREGYRCAPNQLQAQGLARRPALAQRVPSSLFFDIEYSDAPTSPNSCTLIPVLILIILILIARLQILRPIQILFTLHAGYSHPPGMPLEIAVPSIAGTQSHMGQAY